jgi:hypothetical protein
VTTPSSLGSPAERAQKQRRGFFPSNSSDFALRAMMMQDLLPTIG